MANEVRRKLRKNTIALTFKFDCDRFLRFRLADEQERAQLGLAEYEQASKKRPGIQLVTEAGTRWETACFNDVVDNIEEGRVAYCGSDEIDPVLERARFAAIPDVISLLGQDPPPLAIIEGEFKVPVTGLPGLEQAYKKHGLDTINARPDILWIRPLSDGTPLIGGRERRPRYEINVIDVKMAAEPSVRHFVEVTYYALALAQAIKEAKLQERYGVSARGFIWPGTHDAARFRRLIKDARASGDPDPVSHAWRQILRPVPYEIYQAHVTKFFNERLTKVLDQAPLDASWHVGPRCQLCEYLDFCRREAKNKNDLCRVPFLSRAQANVLRKYGIRTVNDLRSAIATDSASWQRAAKESQQLRADSEVLLARASALGSDTVQPVTGRKSAAIPRWVSASIFVTVHFDPGTGITFALGARRVYFPPGGRMERPRIEEHAYIVDRVGQMDVDTERARLLEFARQVKAWLAEVDEDNRKFHEALKEARNSVDKWKRATVHFFFWDSLEVRQLRRMVERHLEDQKVAAEIETLARFFPPEGQLQDPAAFRSQPGTIVKEVFRQLIGLPIPHDYTLYDVAQVFYPRGNEPRRPPFGFGTTLSDQIPFERAYELWTDRILLRKPDRADPDNPDKGLPYTRGEIQRGIERTVLQRLRLLHYLVRRLQQHHGDLLTMRKEPFTILPAQRPQIPVLGQKLYVFEQLNAICAEIENRHHRLLPVPEREARFISIRGILPARGNQYEKLIASIRRADQRLADRPLYAFTFAPTSRDARIREGDFTLALSNETNPCNEGDPPLDLDARWRRYVKHTDPKVRKAIKRLRLGADDGFRYARLSRLLQVEVVQLGATDPEPYIILAPARPAYFAFALDVGLLVFERPMVLDPIFIDFTTKEVEQVLRTVGGHSRKERRSRREQPAD